MVANPISALVAAVTIPLVLSQSTTTVVPALALIGRTISPNASDHFDLTIDANANCLTDSPPCFSLEDNEDGRVKIVATTMSELTYGIGYYMRFYCGMTVGWPTGGGSYSPMPSVWPKIGDKGMSIHRAVPLAWQDNVCTHSYSYAWYDANDWQQHIDWMALSGINRFYAITGQEEIQYKVFRKFNLTDLQIRSFFNGPAFLTWSRGQSMQSVGSPLPRSWMQAQWKLQKQILAMSRALGIIGVLPAFQGNMPPQIRWSYPNANISTGNWDLKQKDADGVCAWVAATDPLFGNVADEWMRTMIADWGTDHWYQCDGFFTGLAPPWDSTAPQHTSIQSSSPPVNVADIKPDEAWAKVWAGAWAGMANTDPEAKWVYQGWAIRGWSDAAGMSRLKALYDAVPHGQWIPLDMDIEGIWRYSNNYSFFGAPFIWTTLHNMGGNDGLKGDMRKLSVMPSDAITAKASIIGTGATPEGIDQNPPYYEYAYDTSFYAKGQDLDEWFSTYATRRYGLTASCASSTCTLAKQAWAILLNEVYNSDAGGWHDNTGVEWGWGLTPPWVYGSDAPAGSIKTMNLSAVAEAWQNLVEVGKQLAPSIPETLNYDVVNVGRELLAQLASEAVLNVSKAVGNDNKAGAITAGNVLQSLLDDLDAFLACDEGFLLGKWIANAKRWQNASDAPDTYYTWQAKSQVSTWWPVSKTDAKLPATLKSMPKLDTYANKHWNGLIKGFYMPRTQCYLDQVNTDLPNTPPAPPQNCIWSQRANGSYLAGYPDGFNPSQLPYPNTLAGATGWCCQHNDCGGVTFQGGQYEARSGSTPIHQGGDLFSLPRTNHAGSGINTTNLTMCVVKSELDFILDSETVYPSVQSKTTIAQSDMLLKKWAGLIHPAPPPPSCDMSAQHINVKLSNTQYADGNGPRTAVNASACCQLCNETPNCNHWSFNVNHSVPGQTCHWAALTYCCWLHQSDANPVESDGWISDVGATNF